MDAHIFFQSLSCRITGHQDHERESKVFFWVYREGGVDKGNGNLWTWETCSLALVHEDAVSSGSLPSNFYILTVRSISLFENLPQTGAPEEQQG